MPNVLEKLIEENDVRLKAEQAALAEKKRLLEIYREKSPLDQAKFVLEHVPVKLNFLLVQKAASPSLELSQSQVGYHGYDQPPQHQPSLQDTLESSGGDVEGDQFAAIADESKIANLLFDGLDKSKLYDLLLASILSARAHYRGILDRADSNYTDAKAGHREREAVRDKHDQGELFRQPSFSLARSATPSGSQNERHKAELERKIWFLDLQKESLQRVSLSEARSFDLSFSALDSPTADEEVAALMGQSQESGAAAAAAFAMPVDGTPRNEEFFEHQHKKARTGLHSVAGENTPPMRPATPAGFWSQPTFSGSGSQSLASPPTPPRSPGAGATS